MKKLDFLVGKWSGDAHVNGARNAKITVRQTENVQFKLEGLVMLVEGTGRNPETGNVVFSALATIAYDPDTHAYRFRAYNGGRYLDTELTVADHGFEWSYKGDSIVIRNVMNLNEAGQWAEFTEVTVGSQPPRRTMEMTLTREKE